MNKTVVIYGLTLALLVLILKIIEYRYLIRTLPTEGYILIIALLFTGLGIWLGNKLTKKNSYHNTESFILNNKAIEALGLSERELEVLGLVADGLSNKEIASRLYVSINTVKTHLANVYSKMQVSRRTEAVDKARTLRIIP